MTGGSEGSRRGAQVRVLPPLIFLVPFLLGWAAHRAVPLPLPGSPAVRWAGAVLLLVALALMGWAALTLWRHRTTVIPWAEVTGLVTSGPFARTRNPIYVADALALAGGSLLVGSWWPLLTLPPAVLAVRRWVVDREEAYLAERFGPAYAAYRARVPRFVAGGRGARHGRL